MLNRIKSKRLTMAELLSIAATIYKKNIKTILFVSFFIIIPLFCINEWLTSKAVINLEYLYNDVIDMDMTAEINAMTSASLYRMVSSIAQMVLQPLANIAIIWGAVNVIKKQTNSAKDNFLYSFSKAPAAVWTTFLQVLFLFVIIFSFLLMMVSAITDPSILSKILLLFTILICVGIVFYFTTIWIFADCVVAIQNMSGLKALIASKRAVQYRFLGIFLYMILFGAFSNGISILGTIALNYVYDNATIPYSIYFFSSMIWSFAYNVVVNGFYIVFLVVLFLNTIWENHQKNSIHYAEVKTNDIPQIQQLPKPKEIKETEKENLENSLIQEQKNDVNLDKNIELEHQNQKDEQSK